MATRDTNSTFDTLIAANVVRPFFAVELLFDSNAVRLWTGTGDLSHEGNTYSGAGDLMSISEVEETSEISAKGANLIISGVESNTLSLALATAYQGRKGTIYFGFFDDSGSPFLVEIFSGYMDEMNIEEGPQTSTVEIKIENKLIDLERPRVRRFTSGYQKTQYPTDRGLDFVEFIQDKDINWVGK